MCFPLVFCRRSLLVRVYTTIILSISLYVINEQCDTFLSSLAVFARLSRDLHTKHALLHHSIQQMTEEAARKCQEVDTSYRLPAYYMLECGIKEVGFLPRQEEQSAEKSGAEHGAYLEWCDYEHNDQCDSNNIHSLLFQCRFFAVAPHILKMGVDRKNDTISPLFPLTCFVDKQRHRLEARFRKLCRSIVQLGEESRCIVGERNGRGHARRQARIFAELTTSRRRSSGNRISHVTGISPTFSIETRPINLAGSGKGRSAFREALDEAKRQLADVRRGGWSRAATARGNDKLGALRTHLSVHDEPGKTSIFYKEADQTVEGQGAPEKLASSPPKRVANKEGMAKMCHLDYDASIRDYCGAKKPSGYPVGSKGDRLGTHPKDSSRKHSEGARLGSRHPNGSSRKQPGGKKSSVVLQTSSDNALHASRDTTLSYQTSENFDEGVGRAKASPRRAKTVSIEAKRSDSKEHALEVHLKLNNGIGHEGSTTDYSTLSKVNNTCTNSNNSRCRPRRDASSSPGRHVKAAHFRRGVPLHHALRENILDDNPRHHPKQTSVASREYACSRMDINRCEPLEQWKRVSSARDNRSLFYRRPEPQSAASASREAATEGLKSSRTRERKPGDGERCFDHNYQEAKAEERDKHTTHEMEIRHYDIRNRKSYDKIRAEDAGEEDAEGQRRWRRRGRALWSTHAEPAARNVSSGSRLVAQQTIRSRSQSPVRPYHGLYARSLQANGIDPDNFRASPCCCGCGTSCATGHMVVDGSLLWREHRVRDSLAAQRTQAPTNGLSDRLEAGRVLDSLNRRAELLGTIPPTLLRAKAAWMENPGDPAYM